MLLTRSTSLSWGLLPRCGGCVGPSTRQPSRRKFFLMVSGVTKISVGLGWKWFAAERRKPKPFSDISRYPAPNSGAVAVLLIFCVQSEWAYPNAKSNEVNRENRTEPCKYLEILIPGFTRLDL